MGRKYMNTKIWERIEKDYKIARTCLISPTDAKKWKRNENKGNYYIFKAYYNAEKQKEKHPLIYARLLMLMHNLFDRRNLFLFKNFLGDAVKYYEQAKAEGYNVADSELSNVISCFKNKEYVSKRENNIEVAKEYIKGAKKYKYFPFYDGYPKRFEHTRNEAFLDVGFDGDVYQFHFLGVYSIEIPDTDLCNNYILNCSCYPQREGDDILYFNMQDYNIWCKEVILRKIGKDD